MSKIRLDLDALSVESFSTDAAPASSGTVHGHSPIEQTFVSDVTGCDQDTCARYCSGNTTCYASCDGSCAQTCGGSCGGTCAQASACYPCGQSDLGSCFWQDCEA